MSLEKSLKLLRINPQLFNKIHSEAAKLKLLAIQFNKLFSSNLDQKDIKNLIKAYVDLNDDLITSSDASNISFSYQPSLYPKTTFFSSSSGSEQLPLKTEKQIIDYYQKFYSQFFHNRPDYINEHKKTAYERYIKDEYIKYRAEKEQKILLINISYQQEINAYRETITTLTYYIENSFIFNILRPIVSLIELFIEQLIFEQAEEQKKYVILDQTEFINSNPRLNFATWDASEGNLIKFPVTNFEEFQTNLETTDEGKAAAYLTHQLFLTEPEEPALSWKDLVFLSENHLTLRYVESDRAEKEKNEGGQGDMVSLAGFGLPIEKDFYEIIFSADNSFWKIKPDLSDNLLEDIGFRNRMIKYIKNDETPNIDLIRLLLVENMEQLIKEHLSNGLVYTFQRSGIPALLLIERFDKPHHFHEGYPLGKFGKKSFENNSVRALVKLDGQFELPDYPKTDTDDEVTRYNQAIGELSQQLTSNLFKQLLSSIHMLGQQVFQSSLTRM